jgi:hypothetical protein
LSNNCRWNLVVLLLTLNYFFANNIDLLDLVTLSSALHVQLNLELVRSACLRELVVGGFERHVVSFQMLEVVGSILDVRFFKE